LGKAYTYLRMKSLSILVSVVVGAQAFFNFTREACPKAPYWPVNKTYSYGPNIEPTQLCFDGTSMPDGYNGFLLNFSDVKLVSPGKDSLCAVLGVLPFSGGDISYVTSSCSMQEGSVVAYGGVCRARAVSDGYFMAFGSESALLTPTPLRTLLSFSLTLQWTNTRIC